MTASELIDRLSQVPPDTIVIISKDAEGNGFSPLEEADEAARYVPDNEWSGDVLHPDDYDEYDAADLVPAVCLWPVN